MITRNSAGLYPWSKDLEASSDVRLREREGFAMLLGWLDKFVAGSGSSPGREVCERFWKEQVRAKPREKWQLDQWGAAMRWYLRWLEHRKAKGGEVRSLPERVRDAVDRAGARQGKALRTIQTLLGHADVKTTEIYTHVAKGVGALGVRSSLDRMERV